MTRIRIVAAIALGLIAALAGKAFLARQSRSVSDQIIVFGRGATIRLNPGSAEFKSVVEEAEHLFESATSTYKLIIDKGLIERQLQEGAVEVIYAAPKKLRSRGSDFQISRLLVPIKGRFAAGSGPAVFFGDPEYREFNVVITPVRLDRMNELVGKLK